VGKAVGLPLYQLWGGKRDRVRVYASTVHLGKTPEARAQDCLAYLERGYRAVKLRLSAEVLVDNLKLVDRCPAAVGDRMTIMVNANQAGGNPALDETGTWGLDVAREAARHLADLDVAWLEEPLPYEMEEAGARLRRESDVAIAGGECGVGLRPFGAFLQKGIYDILQPDPITGGTPTDMLKIMAMAEGAGVPAVFRHARSGVGFLLGLHLCTAFGDAPWLEYMDDERYCQPEGFQAGFSQPYPIDAEGYAHCPQEPGLGADWDFDWLQAIGLG
jgi:L-alanine-DL-glutamate epimerase-like enolase superfamily enzyme